MPVCKVRPMICPGTIRTRLTPLSGKASSPRLTPNIKTFSAPWERLGKARDVLLQAVAIDSSAMDGSGLITLGALYFRVPKFGSFGDDDKARQYLQQALKVDPDNIDANFSMENFF